MAEELNPMVSIGLKKDNSMLALLALAIGFGLVAERTASEQKKARQVCKQVKTREMKPSH